MVHVDTDEGGPQLSTSHFDLRVQIIMEGVNTSINYKHNELTGADTDWGKLQWNWNKSEVNE